MNSQQSDTYQESRLSMKVKNQASSQESGNTPRHWSQAIQVKGPETKLNLWQRTKRHHHNDVEAAVPAVLGKTLLPVLWEQSKMWPFSVVEMEAEGPWEKEWSQMTEV